MDMPSWDEIRTAYQVAKSGTVSAAAQVLGVHHATVIRHVDALEARLGVKLFQRHARGYQPTEAGQELLAVAGVADDQLTQLVGRIRGRSDVVTGDLIITTVAGFGAVLTQSLAQFQVDHPDVRVRLLSDDRLFRLDYGEAHVAVRAGKKPQEPDNVVQLWTKRAPVLCASRDYVERYGVPVSTDEFPNHRFIGPESIASRAPPNIWLQGVVPPENFVLRASEVGAVIGAVRAGIGIGFIWDVPNPESSDLVVVMQNDDDWAVTLWLVTHVDLHRTPKVQAILETLKKDALKWQR